MGTSGDKIVLLDGMGSGSGSAANGLLSMIPGMFTSLLGGNKMDPNLVAALMNGRNNQDQFGGANGWWLWIIVLFWLWGGRGFGNGFGNGNECCANGLPAQLNNDYGRELLMQAIQGNRSAIDQISNALNCSTSQLQNAICNVQGAIDKVAGQVGMTSQAVINAVQQQGCEIGNQISACCCNLQSANLVNVSEPRFAQSQLGQYQQLQDRVMDLTIEVDGKSMTYVVPENQNVAMANGITLACSVDPIMNHLNAMKRTSTDIVNSVDKNKEIIEACDSILEDINPTFKQSKDQDRKIKGLEDQVAKMGESFEELKNLLIKKLG